MHSVDQYAAGKFSSRPLSRRFFQGAIALAAVSVAGCGNTYRPVVSSINPVGPAEQPTKYAVAISSNGANSPGLVTMVDFSGDTTLITANLGANPKYLILDSTGSTGYSLNGDGTFNSFSISTSLLTSNVLQTTLPFNANPVAILPQGGNLYIADTGNNGVAQLTEASPPAFKQELATGVGSIYTVGISGAPRVYALVQGSNTAAAGTVKAIETTNNTISATIPVGIAPTYGVMTSDSRRAFILNKGSNTVSVINAQTNAQDTFTNTSGVVTGTIPVGVAPVWADFDPTRIELVVANQGNGRTAGSVSIISIPLCTANTVTSNPNCDVANPVDAVGFGTVLATIPVGVNPVMVAVMQDGSQAFVANAGNAAAGIAGSVSVINLNTNTVVGTIPAANSTIASDAVIHGHPGTIAVTTGIPTGKVYVTSPDSTDLTIIRTDTDIVQTHLTLQGLGVQVRVSSN